MKRTALRRKSAWRKREKRPKYSVAADDPTANPEWMRVVDGREILDTSTAEGNAEYVRRKQEMRLRQGGICCFYGFLSECPGVMRGFCTFDHEHGRGMGGAKRDDRIEVNGLWQNGAAHPVCNNLAGSRQFNYNLTIQARMNHADTATAEPRGRDSETPSGRLQDQV